MGGAWVACAIACLGKSICTACITPWLGRTNTTCLEKGTTCLGLNARIACIPSWLGTSTFCLGKSACTAHWLGTTYPSCLRKSATCLGRTNINCLGRSATCLGLSACIPPLLGPVLLSWRRVPKLPALHPGWGEVALTAWGRLLPAWGKLALVAWERALPAWKWVPGLPALPPGLGASAVCLGKNACTACLGSAWPSYVSFLLY